MPGTVTETRRGPAERLIAWAFTGPLGHFYSVVVDVLAFAVRSLIERARRGCAAQCRARGRWRDERAS